MTAGATWTRLAVVAAVAVITFAAIDVAVARFIPQRRLSEVTDGVAALRRSDPTTLVLGSSHARTFEVVDRELERRTNGRERIVAIPVEYGKMTSYDWVLTHRLLPLIDDSAGGRPKRPSLERFVLVTEWWDSCAPEGGVIPPNVPARAWTATDFLADLRAHGLTDYNRSYVAERWRQLFLPSALMQDRGHGRLGSTLYHRLRPGTDEEEYAGDVRTWQAMIENGTKCIGDPTQMAALSHILTVMQQRHLDLTILLYPRKPATMTDSAKATTLARWATIAADTAAAHGARLVDLTSTSPLTDAEFSRDFDHVTPVGNELFSRWALDGPLAYFASRPGPQVAAP